MSKDLLLYQFPECPFCQRVFRKMDELGVEIPMKNTRADSQARDELIKLNGSSQVPCLIIDGEPLLESLDICNFLDQEFGK